jgi:hypothetical protein
VSKLEEVGLKVFEKRVLRKIFGPKTEEVMGGWRKLHNEELYNLYFSPHTLGLLNQGGWNGWSMYHGWET